MVPTPVPFVFRLDLPTPKVDRKTGAITDHYLVDLCTETCTCEGFFFMRGLCKHLIWAKGKFEAAKRFLTPTYTFDGPTPRPAAPAPAAAQKPARSG